MALKGNLRDFSVTQLLNLVNVAQKTGTLVVERSQEQVFVSFREGKLSFARNGADAAGLTMVLYHAKKLNAAQVRAINERSGGMSDKELGLLLINSNYHQPARDTFQLTVLLPEYGQSPIHLE